MVLDVLLTFVEAVQMALCCCAAFVVGVGGVFLAAVAIRGVVRIVGLALGDGPVEIDGDGGDIGNMI